MEIDQLSTLKSSNHWVSDCDLSRTEQNRSTCSCKHLDCPNNGTRCVVNGGVKLSNYGGIKLTTNLKSFFQA